MSKEGLKRKKINLYYKSKESMPKNVASYIKISQILGNV